MLDKDLCNEFFALNPLGLLIVDSVGNIVNFNQSFRDIFGVFHMKSYNLFQDMNFRNIGIIEHISSLNHGESAKFNDIWINPQKIDPMSNKSSICVFIRVFKIQTYFALQFQDITFSRNIEESIIDTELRYKRIFERSSDVVFSVHLDDGTISSINEAGLNLTGYRIDEILGISFKEFIAPNSIEFLTDLIQQKQKGLATQDYHEIEIISKSGEKFLGEVNLQFIYQDQEATEVLGFLRHISQSQKVTLERIKQERLESIGNLAGGIAHDFNNILASLLGNVSLALEENNLEDIKSILRETESGIMRAKNLTYQLLTFSKGGKPVKSNVSITQLISSTAIFALRGSKSKCTLDFDEKMWDCYVDSNQISQVIGNIVINADQSMSKGGEIILSFHNFDTKTNFLRYQEIQKKINLLPGKYIEIMIQDHGTGIPKDIQSRIFEPYFSTKSSGSGLGLATAYSIVKGHNGYIYFISSTAPETHGTTFYIYLPVISEGLSSNSVSPPKSKSSKSTSNKTILVLEDDPSIQKILVKMFKHLKHHAIFTDDGKDTILKYKEAKSSENPVDLLIMDLTIPGAMGGKETIVLLKEFDPNVKAIVSSGYSNDPIMADPISYGFIGVLKKPFTLQQLKDIINRSL
ncbi:PAS domain S-box protein [Candidatus Lokiarchaeum ossiferum]|uniref:PAS domain S-box protein n=1 Tax=Candidatus Lokiarchaeum ossiferum TaxID=2951803 RepID=UPI00352F6FBB